jgi:hypothetical protein
VGYGVGIVSFGPKVPNRRFYSLLIAVEAKPTDNLETALPQLIVYLACLRQGRMAPGRKDSSVHGVISDGFDFRFVTITHEGVVKVSRSFNISRGEMQTVNMYILRTTMERSPTVAPEKIKDQSGVGETSYRDDARNSKTSNHDTRMRVRMRMSKCVYWIYLLNRTEP